MHYHRGTPAPRGLFHRDEIYTLCSHALKIAGPFPLCPASKRREFIHSLGQGGEEPDQGRKGYPDRTAMPYAYRRGQQRKKCQTMADNKIESYERNVLSCSRDSLVPTRPRIIPESIIAQPAWPLLP